MKLPSTTFELGAALGIGVDGLSAASSWVPEIVTPLRPLSTIVFRAATEFPPTRFPDEAMNTPSWFGIGSITTVAVIATDQVSLDDIAGGGGGARTRGRGGDDAGDRAIHVVLDDDAGAGVTSNDIAGLGDLAADDVGGRVLDQDAGAGIGPGGGPQDRDGEAGQADLGADLVVGDGIASRRRIQDVDAVSQIARDQVPRPGRSLAARLADMVVRREQEHAVAAVVEDEIGVDRVARPLGAVDDHAVARVPLDQVAIGRARAADDIV